MLAVGVNTDRFVFANHHFSNPELLVQALTHRSAGTPHNERLEFLGDALIGAIIAEALFLRWPKANEGVLTRARSQLVRESSLATIARQLDLGANLILGPGELKSGGHRRDSILADAVEALAAAIYLDTDFEVCREVVLGWFEEPIQALEHVKQMDKDPKSQLQEWLQAKQLTLPVYDTIAEEGDEHERHFSVRCVVEALGVSAKGEGSSRKAAEQQAAMRVLEQLTSKA